MLKTVPGPAVKPAAAVITTLVYGVAPFTPSRKVEFETARLPTWTGVRKKVLVSSSTPEFVMNMKFVVEAMLLDTLSVPPLIEINGELGILPEPTNDNKPPTTMVLL